jgi:NTE family protein
MARLPVGVALSGGTARSVLHVGVLKALQESGIPVDYIAGTSGGSIAAAIYAFGEPIDVMEKVAASLSWWKLASIRVSRLGFISSRPIEMFLDKTLQGATFEDLKIPCAIPLTDLATGERVTLRNGPVARVVRASCSIPLIYLPVEIDGRHYVDGGLAEYLPVQSVQGFGPQFTLAVNLNTRVRDYKAPKHKLGLVIQFTSMVARQNVGASVRRADYVLHPDVDGYSPFDFSAAEELIDLGYRFTREHAEDIKREWKRKSSWLGRLQTFFDRRARHAGMHNPETMNRVIRNRG